MKLIISATDGSEGAERAIAVAAEFARSSKAKVQLVHVGEDGLSSKQLMLLGQFRITEGDALDEISRRLFSRAKEIAEHRGATDIKTLSGGGDPAKVLIETIKTKQADAIVIGRRGRGSLRVFCSAVFLKSCRALRRAS
ncbi:universal stress protein [Bradyrhizobium quebecense]|uniref:Universal stress protein n=1 Tax=Bradyrhizobium quebecense TaxID=2748629 RepID=A0A973WIT3_9BRAD|nr:universal stress protein [Bradyrhizobium quebecense]UGA41464.1 universal stress protein [Bradyrhizobium quebecense]